MSRRSYGFLLAVFAGATLAPTLSAQSDVAVLRRQFEALRARQQMAGDAFDSLRAAQTSPYNDSLVAAGRRVRFIAGQLSARDQAVLKGALEQVASDLTAQFGASAGALNDTTSWSLQPRSGRSVRRYLRLDLGTKRQAYSPTTFVVPLDSLAVVRVARNQAKAALPSLHPWLAQYLRSGFELDHAWPAYAWAGRSIATSGSSVGRRCQAGSLDECRTILDVTRGGLDHRRLYTPEDWPDLARRLGKPRGVTDSAWTAARDACSRRAEPDACRRVLAWQAPPMPFRDDVRTTLVVEALLMGGDAGIGRVLAARDRFRDDPVGFFAHVAGVGEDSLINVWRARIDDAAKAEVQRSMLPVYLTTLGWGGLLMLVGARRRRL
jgi:hypothetical protein